MHHGANHVSQEGVARRFMAAGVLAALFLLSGCAAPRPPAPEEVLRRLAADAAGKPYAATVPETPEDAAAIQRAAAEVNEHVTRLRAEAALPAVTPKTDYEVAVTAPRSMAGTWRLVSPTSLTLLDEKKFYGAVRTYLCRVDQKGEAVQGSCLPTRVELSGKVHEDAVNLDWGSTIVSAEIVGRLVSSTDFAGVLVLGAFGINLGKDLPVYASKIPNSVPAPPDIDAMAAQVIAADPKLGAVRERLYLGAVDAAEETPEPIEIYDVEFERGWKLCGFTRKADGMFDHLECR